MSGIWRGARGGKGLGDWLLSFHHQGDAAAAHFIETGWAPSVLQALAAVCKRSGAACHEELDGEMWLTCSGHCSMLHGQTLMQQLNP